MTETATGSNQMAVSRGVRKPIFALCVYHVSDQFSSDEANSSTEVVRKRLRQQNKLWLRTFASKIVIASGTTDAPAAEKSF